MRSKIIFLILLLIQLNVNAQKGMFKKGTIQPSVYKEQLAYTLVNQLIYVTVEIEGKEYIFLVDTGAPSTIRKNLDVDFVFLKKESIMDAMQNTQEVDYVTLPSIKIGNLTFDNFVFMQEDLTVFEDLGIDGIIGGNITARGAWDFDLQKNSITVSNTLDQAWLKEANFSAFKMKKTDIGTPLLSLTYFDRIKEKGIFFDTGYSGLFYLSASMFDKVKPYVSDYITGEGILSKNAFGNSVGETALLPLKMKLGQQHIPIFFSDVEEDEESNLGVEWLSHYRVIIYKNTFYFSNEGQRGFETKFVGKGIKTAVENGELLVTFVWHNSPAHKQGIQLGDKIQAVNGQQVADLTLNEQLELKKTMETSPEITVEITRLNHPIVLKEEVLLTGE
ncbi:PDZ domain-containing protein [Myroides sp. DW712]|uniref:PDZ domain-containing protein n=1 Tax=Myroides sp. DW712 TaxID=3389800 RepID=UPI00397B16DC